MSSDTTLIGLSSPPLFFLLNLYSTEAMREKEIVRGFLNLQVLQMINLGLYVLKKMLSMENCDNVCSDSNCVTDIVHTRTNQNSTKHGYLRSMHSQWLADIHLRLGHTPRGTRLLSSTHSGPLYIQKPFYPEGPDVAHVYLLHPPGGLVSGDCLNIQIDAGEDCAVLLTTPGAGRIYRSRSDRALQKQTVNLFVGQGGSLEWLPLETIVYPDSGAALTTRVELSEGSCFMGWDITCFGLPASNAEFDSGELRQRLEIYSDQILVFRENLSVTDFVKNILQSKAGFQGFSVNGIFVAGPVSTEGRQELLEQLQEIPPPEQALGGVSLVGDFIVIRYLGSCAHYAREWFSQHWSLLRQHLLGRRVVKPRIWLT